MQHETSVPWGYVEHNGRILPSFEIARTATVSQVFEWLGKMATVRKSMGLNGVELRGWCPWGETHGKQGSFSINIESGKGMCHACKRKCSHVVKFAALYIETHPTDPLFAHIAFKGDQAGAAWIIEKLREENGQWEGIPQDASTQHHVVHDTDAITSALRQLGLALRDEATLREIAEILARPR
jgi:hypothetical protein